jgi:hypothetical protein
VTSHLLVALSPHGYGHAAMTAPVLNEIRRKNHDIKVTLYSNLPLQWLRSRITFDFDYLEGISDFGLVMRSATEIDLDASAQGYRRLHEGWEDKIALEGKRLASLKPTLILANIPHLVLAGAKRVGIPCLAMSSLNWADIYQAYLGDRAEAPGILAQMRQAYAGAGKFLKLSPGLPMDDLPHVVHLGPSALIGRNLRVELRSAVDISPTQRLALLGFGGIPTRLPIEAWPAIPGWTILIPPEWAVAPQGFIPWDRTGLNFLDFIASVDVLITKPGYGSFTEAACNGTAVLAQERPDWPETSHFEAWMRRHASFAALPEAALGSGQIGKALNDLMESPKPVPPKPSGIAEASAIILEALGNLQ